MSIWTALDLPTGITVSYEGNGKTIVGEHTVKAKFTNKMEDAKNYNAIEDMEATLTIYYAVLFYPNEENAENGEHVFNEQKCIDSDGKVKKPASDPERKGYEFKGWAKSGKTLPFNFDNNEIDDNTVFVAIWDAVEYSITYKLTAVMLKKKIWENTRLKVKQFRFHLLKKTNLFLTAGIVTSSLR